MGNIFDVSPATVGSDPAVVDERCPSVCPEMLVKALAAETADGRAFKRVALNSEDTFLIIVEDVLSRQECLQLIQTFETRGFAQALITGADGKQRLDRGVRDSCQIVLEDDELAELLTRRLMPYLPYRWNGCKVEGLHDRFSGLRYEVGQRFLPHMDVGKRRQQAEGDKAGQRSFITMQLYLNDDFQGGATRFFEGNSRYLAPAYEYTKPYFDMVSCAGSVCLFQHNVWHSGEPVTAEVKYTLRGDVMYGRYGEE